LTPAIRATDISPKLHGAAGRAPHLKAPVAEAAISHKTNNRSANGRSGLTSG
jgi:hypothetical protein